MNTCHVLGHSIHRADQINPKAFPSTKSHNPSISLAAMPQVSFLSIMQAAMVDWVFLPFWWKCSSNYLKPILLKCSRYQHCWESNLFWKTNLQAFTWVTGFFMTFTINFFLKKAKINQHLLIKLGQKICQSSRIQDQSSILQEQLLQQKKQKRSIHQLQKVKKPEHQLYT